MKTIKFIIIIMLTILLAISISLTLGPPKELTSSTWIVVGE